MTPPSLPPISSDLYLALKADIARRGILIPLLFDSRTGKCLDGMVRLKIAEELGLSPGKIPRLYVGDLSPAEREDYRLVVNGLRRHLNREQLREVISWALRRNPESSDNRIAKRTGASDKTVASVRKGLEATSEIPKRDTRIGSNGKPYPARKPMVFTHTSAQNREARDALNSIGTKAPPGVISLRKLRKIASMHQRAEESREAGPDLPSNFRLYHADFRDLGDRLKPGSVAAIVCDPPWFGFDELHKPFAETIVRLLRSGGFAAIYTGHSCMLTFADALREVGLDYRWLISCVNDDRRGAIRNNGSIYTCARPVLVMQKGGRFKTPSMLRDVFYCKVREKDLFEWQQPLEEAVMLVKALTRPGELIADICGGSFTTGAAVAVVGGGRRFVGCDIREDLVRVGRRRIAAALGDPKEGRSGEPCLNGTSSSRVKGRSAKA